MGRKLFFDPVLSRDGTTSCVTCHEPGRAFTVGERFAKGIRGQPTKRNPPALLNRAYGRSFFWDGRAKTLEEQALQPIPSPPVPGTSQQFGRVRLDNQSSYLTDSRIRFRYH